MNIYFTLPKFLIENIGNDLAGIHTEIDSVRLPHEGKKIITELKNRIIERFKLFKGEIDIEELSNDETYILMDFTNHPVEIKYINYSDKLETKMKSSFTQEDLDYLEKYGNIR